MHRIIKTLLSLIFIMSYSGAFGAAAPSPKIATVPAANQKLYAEGNAQERLKKLADSLGLNFTKSEEKSRFNSSISYIRLSLINKAGQKCAYLEGEIDVTTKIAYLDQLEVLYPDLRRKGIASLLCEVFYAFCCEKGCKKIIGLAASFGDRPIGRDTLLSFYKNLGGQQVKSAMTERGYCNMQYTILTPLQKYKRMLALRLLLDQPIVPFIPSKL